MPSEPMSYLVLFAFVYSGTERGSTCNIDDCLQIKDAAAYVYQERCYVLTNDKGKWDKASKECEQMADKYGMDYGRVANFYNPDMYSDIMKNLQLLTSGASVANGQSSTFDVNSMVWLGAQCSTGSSSLSDYCWMTSRSTEGSQVAYDDVPVTVLSTKSDTLCLAVQLDSPTTFYGDACKEHLFMISELGCDETPTPVCPISDPAATSPCSQPGVCPIWYVANTTTSSTTSTTTSATTTSTSTTTTTLTSTPTTRITSSTTSSSNVVTSSASSSSSSPSTTQATSRATRTLPSTSSTVTSSTTTTAPVLSTMTTSESTTDTSTLPTSTTTPSTATTTTTATASTVMSSKLSPTVQTSQFTLTFKQTSAATTEAPLETSTSLFLMSSTPAFTTGTTTMFQSSTATASTTQVLSINSTTVLSSTTTDSSTRATSSLATSSSTTTVPESSSAITTETSSSAPVSSTADSPSTTSVRLLSSTADRTTVTPTWTQTSGISATNFTSSVLPTTDEASTDIFTTDSGTDLNSSILISASSLLYSTEATTTTPSSAQSTTQIAMTDAPISMNSTAQEATVTSDGTSTVTISSSAQGRTTGKTSTIAATTALTSTVVMTSDSSSETSTAPAETSTTSSVIQTSVATSDEISTSKSTKKKFLWTFWTRRPRSSSTSSTTASSTTTTESTSRSTDALSVSTTLETVESSATTTETSTTSPPVQTSVATSGEANTSEYTTKKKIRWTFWTRRRRSSTSTTTELTSTPTDAVSTIATASATDETEESSTPATEMSTMSTVIQTSADTNSVTTTSTSSTGAVSSTAATATIGTVERSTTSTETNTKLTEPSWVSETETLFTTIITASSVDTESTATAGSEPTPALTTHLASPTTTAVILDTTQESTVIQSSSISSIPVKTTSSATEPVTTNSLQLTSTYAISDASTQSQTAAATTTSSQTTSRQSAITSSSESLTTMVQPVPSTVFIKTSTVQQSSPTSPSSYTETISTDTARLTEAQTTAAVITSTSQTERSVTSSTFYISSLDTTITATDVVTSSSENTPVITTEESAGGIVSASRHTSIQVTPTVQAPYTAQKLTTVMNSIETAITEMVTSSATPTNMDSESPPTRPSPQLIFTATSTAAPIFSDTVTETPPQSISSIRPVETSIEPESTKISAFAPASTPEHITALATSTASAHSVTSILTITATDVVTSSSESTPVITTEESAGGSVSPSRHTSIQVMPTDKSRTAAIISTLSNSTIFQTPEATVEYNTAVVGTTVSSLVAPSTSTVGQTRLPQPIVQPNSGTTTAGQISTMNPQTERSQSILQNAPITQSVTTEARAVVETNISSTREASKSETAAHFSTTLPISGISNDIQKLSTPLVSASEPVVKDTTSFSQPSFANPPSTVDIDTDSNVNTPDSASDVFVERNHKTTVITFPTSHVAAGTTLAVDVATNGKNQPPVNSPQTTASTERVTVAIGDIVARQYSTTASNIPTKVSNGKSITVVVQSMTTADVRGTKIKTVASTEDEIDDAVSRKAPTSLANINDYSGSHRPITSYSTAANENGDSVNRHPTAGMLTVTDETGESLQRKPSTVLQTLDNEDGNAVMHRSSSYPAVANEIDDSGNYKSTTGGLIVNDIGDRMSHKPVTSVQTMASDMGNSIRDKPETGIPTMVDEIGNDVNHKPTKSPQTTAIKNGDSVSLQPKSAIQTMANEIEDTVKRKPSTGLPVDDGDIGDSYNHKPTSSRATIATEVIYSVYQKSTNAVPTAPDDIGNVMNRRATISMSTVDTVQSLGIHTTADIIANAIHHRPTESIQTTINEVGDVVKHNPTTGIPTAADVDAAAADHKPPILMTPATNVNIPTTGITNEIGDSVHHRPAESIQTTAAEGGDVVQHNPTAGIQTEVPDDGADAIRHKPTTVMAPAPTTGITNEIGDTVNRKPTTGEPTANDGAGDPVSNKQTNSPMAEHSEPTTASPMSTANEIADYGGAMSHKATVVILTVSNNIENVQNQNAISTETDEVADAANHNPTNAALIVEESISNMVSHKWITSPPTVIIESDKPVEDSGGNATVDTLDDLDQLSGAGNRARTNSLSQMFQTSAFFVPSATDQPTNGDGTRKTCCDNESLTASASESASPVFEPPSQSVAIATPVNNIGMTSAKTDDSSSSEVEQQVSSDWPITASSENYFSAVSAPTMTLGAASTRLENGGTTQFASTISIRALGQESTRPPAFDATTTQVGCNTEWGPYSPCAVTCGSSMRTRQRQQYTPDNSSVTCAVETETTECDLPKCTPMTKTEQVVSNVMMNIGCIWILVGLGCSIIAVCALRSRYYLQVIQLNEDVSLFAAHVLVLFLSMRDDRKFNRDVCKFAAFGLQYFFCVTYAFQALEAFHIFTVLTNVVMGNNVVVGVKTALATGWGVPAVITSATAATSYNYVISSFSCWINFGHWVSIATFVPVSLIGMCLITLLEATGQWSQFTKSPSTVSCTVARAGLAYVSSAQTASWLMASIAVYYQHVSLFSIVFGFNFTLGIFIFIFHFCSNEKGRAALRSLYHRFVRTRT